MKKHSSFYVGEQIEIPVRSYFRNEDKSCLDWLLPIIAFIAIVVTLATVMFSCRDGDVIYASEVRKLKASWYSIESLKKEGTWKTSKGVMANGKQFKDEDSTCATRLFPLQTMLRITNTRNGKSVIVMVTDRIGKRFATTRIDLSRSAFSKIADLKEGLINIKVEEL